MMMVVYVALSMILVLRTNYGKMMVQGRGRGRAEGPVTFMLCCSCHLIVSCRGPASSLLLTIVSCIISSKLRGPAEDCCARIVAMASCLLPVATSAATAISLGTSVVAHTMAIFSSLIASERDCSASSSLL